MSLASVEKLSPAPVPAGGVHFVTAARHADLCTDLRVRRYLVAPVGPPHRGRLRHAIDAAVESALALRGALPSAVDLEAALEPTLRDQVFRARALGATGLAVALPSLGGVTDGGVLDVADSAALAAWLTAARRGPLLLVLDETDRAARLLAPVALGDLAGVSPLAASSDSTPPPSGEIEALAARPPESEPAPVAPPPVLTMPRRGLMKKRSALRTEPLEAPREEGAQQAPAPTLLQKAAALMPLVSAGDATPANERTAPAPPVFEDELASTLCSEPELLVVEASTPKPTPAPTAARRAVDAAEWRAQAVELDRARGPKPVSVIERLYVTRYAPLLGALTRGEGDAAVKSVVDAWRQSFEHSYREAFSALRVTGKRPPMVFDAPEIAGRIGRLNGARAVKLLLVDAMRFDVGERVGDRLKERLAGRAVCVEQMLLWAAIPTNTQTQMGLLGRGLDGLRDAEPASDPDPEIVRGRAVGTIRRERVGAREVMKLDVVEARLRSPGPGYDDRLDALADEVTPILVKYIESLPPRTLLFLFGDHGFRMPASMDGRTTGAASQGGVSPEEVLVPGQAWLVGGVH